MITVDWSARWAEYSPDKIAAGEFETDRTLTYRELNRAGSLAAAYLSRETGLVKGDRIAILAENCLEYLILLSAAQKTGIILVPLNYRLTSREIDYLISDSQPSMLLTEEKFRSKLKDSSAAAGIGWQQDIVSFFDSVKKYEASGSLSRFTEMSVFQDDAALIIYTSGTTAFPKGSVYTHGMMFWNSINTQLRLDLTSADRSINMAPPFHTGSWNVLLSPFLHHGAYTLLMRNFDADSVLRALVDYELTIFWAVPTMLKMMAESPLFDELDLSKIRYFVVGGEAMPVPLIQRYHSKGIPIRQGYGLTEVGPNVTSLNHQDAIRKAGSIGKPNFYYRFRLVNDKDEEVKPGEAGELILSGPTVTPGYWCNPEATSATIRDGWFHTGDIMRCDEEGFLFVVDRIKNMYISGAENVYPAEVEFLLRSHPGIDAVAIIGVPDPKWGETGMAFVVPEKNSSLTPEDVILYCEGRLAKYKIPKYVRFLDELPKNDAGKIDRQRLKQISLQNQ
ncbi:MAG TPA: long-chain fatty acid--CoA ligase [Lentimicrobium sp.]|nr:long-chain fatty acid--CoA ligase [Lentimicrobium sp.]